MGAYVNSGGLRTYYEIHGTEGDPVFLLHGGGVGGTTWHGQTATLAQRFRVHVPDRRGHGRTPDAAGPYSYEVMAEDTLTLMETLGTGAAHLIGWSDGGAVALRVALSRPEQVRSLTLIGTSVSRDGDTAAARELMHGTAAEARLREMFEPQYAAHTPDGPDHFPVVFEKCLRMWREQRDITPAEADAGPGDAGR